MAIMRPVRLLILGRARRANLRRGIGDHYNHAAAKNSRLQDFHKNRFQEILATMKVIICVCLKKPTERSDNHETIKFG